MLIGLCEDVVVSRPRQGELSGRLLVMEMFSVLVAHVLTRAVFCVEYRQQPSVKDCQRLERPKILLWFESQCLPQPEVPQISQIHNISESLQQQQGEVTLHVFSPTEFCLCVGFIKALSVFPMAAPDGSFQQLLQLQDGAERSHAEVDHSQQQPGEGEVEIN